MAEDRATELLKRSGYLFEKKQTLHSLWQEIADNFYPERADFTVTRDVGDEFASHLMTSYPCIVRRDLGDSFAAMLRSGNWFSIRADREEREDVAARAWLESRTGIMRRAMYDKKAKFVRATKAGDHDFAAFGNACLSVELDMKNVQLLYRSWHLRDVAWCEDVSGEIDTVFRKWKMTARDAVKMFPKTAGAKLNEKAEKAPYEEVELLHAILPADGYEAPVGKKFKTPYVTVFVNPMDKAIMLEAPSPTMVYVIPRWAKHESQYAFSPAAMVALPDARLMQAMTRVLLEAGEKAVDPPLLGVQEAIRSDIQVFAGGITWVDSEYDERLGEVLRPLTQDKSGIPAGFEMSDRTRGMLAEGFYISKITLPPPDSKMTAYEAGQRVAQHIRQALPIYEPMESDYNGQICEATFDLMMMNGGFGAREDIPQSIRGTDVQFRFENPLREAIERQKGNQFLEAKAMIANAADLDPAAGQIIDARQALRDVLAAIGTPAKWTRSEEQMEEIDANAAAQKQAQELLAGLGQSAEVTRQIGEAGQAIQGVQAAA